MNDFKAFLGLFFRRLFGPAKFVWRKTYQLLPQSIKAQFATCNLQLAILIFLLLIILLNYFLPKNEIAKAKLIAGRWPILPASHFKMAKIYFGNGYEEEAKKEFYKTSSALSFLVGRKIFPRWQEEAIKTERLVIEKEKIKKEVNYWGEVLENKPNFRDVYLRLAVLYYQIWEDAKAKEYWSKAFYLDPNNKVVQEIGQKLNLKEN